MQWIPIDHTKQDLLDLGLMILRACPCSEYPHPLENHNQCEICMALHYRPKNISGHAAHRTISNQLILMTPCSDTTCINDVQWCTNTQHDVAPDQDSSAPRWSISLTLEGSRLSQNENLSKIPLWAESDSSVKRNLLLFFVCPKMICSAPRETGFLVRYVQSETQHWMPSVKCPLCQASVCSLAPQSHH